ncbi:hypothetical protein C4Q27_07885 [Pseudomonas sp. SWI36]|nr:hypothetical protein C4Q27_07885 [Pseudomonas sp. SWI36]
MEAGVPAKQATRWLAPALPVFAGKPHRDHASFQKLSKTVAPTGVAVRPGGTQCLVSLSR